MKLVGINAWSRDYAQVGVGEATNRYVTKYTIIFHFNLSKFMKNIVRKPAQNSISNSQPHTEGIHLGKSLVH